MQSAPDRGETERIRHRMQLLIRITARPGIFRAGIMVAARRLTPEEARILTDLEASGMDVIQLREVLRGAHVLVDDPELYDAWRAFKRSRTRISSHHRTVDKTRYPDIGLKGPLVREKLHGRTAAGTWVQLEKTPASMGGKKLPLPTWTDIQHLWDYIVYRIRRSNVGPWGLSRLTEKRPMYLSPSLHATVPLPTAANEEVAGALARIEADDDVTSASPDLARRFPPPERANDLLEVAFRPGESPGRGLFGGSDVWVTEAASDSARTQLSRQDDSPPAWELPEPGSTRRESLAVGERELAFAVRAAGP